MASDTHYLHMAVSFSVKHIDGVFNENETGFIFNLRQMHANNR